MTRKKTTTPETKPLRRPPGGAPLERRLAYRFRDRALLEEAQCHSSYVNEAFDPAIRDNERLEFLGDAVLNLVVGHALLARFPASREGELSRMRASLVNEKELARLSRRLGVGAGLKLGRGEARTGGRAKDSILAGALEAVVAAVYLDGGFEAASALVGRLFAPLIAGLEPGGDSPADFKSRLQELVQAAPGARPVYTVVRAEGPDHDKTFVVRLEVLGRAAEGTGKSKKAAEQDAAARLLAELAR
jgi:ribonuclease III